MCARRSLREAGKQQVSFGRAQTTTSILDREDNVDLWLVVSDVSSWITAECAYHLPVVPICLQCFRLGCFRCAEKRDMTLSVVYRLFKGDTEADYDVAFFL
jgi:hypothetical protein